MKKVHIYQRIIPHYRIAFFEGLKMELEKNDIQLTVYYGQHSPKTVPKGQILNQSWTVYRRNWYLRLFGAEVVYQTPFLNSFREADLIIVEQANRLVANYLFLSLKNFLPYKLAFWGHGWDRQQTSRQGVRAWLKKKLLGSADYWFAYTSSVKRYLVDNNVNPELITCVQNSIDHTPLIEPIIDDQQKLAALNKLGFKGRNVALFCGGMDQRKNIPFLIEAIIAIKEKIPDFEMIFIGNGPLFENVESFSKEKEWVANIGEVVSSDRKIYFDLAKLMLMPGSLGLVIIDSFVTETPIVTTNILNHNPEFDYLQNNDNCRICDNDLEEYIKATTSLLDDNDSLEMLKNGCRSSATTYTLDNMIANFRDGILKSLSDRT